MARPHAVTGSPRRSSALALVAPCLLAAVLQRDDALVVDLSRRFAGRLRTIGYSLGGSSRGVVDEWLSLGPAIEVASSWGDGKLLTRQLGRFNLSNVLGVVGA